MKIKIVKNNILPFGKYVAMAIYPVIFVRKKYWIRYSEKRREIILNHEKIHFAQQKELTSILFYIEYVYWWLIRGYKNIPFEKEAYANENDLEYLKHREKFAYKKYI